MCAFAGFFLSVLLNSVFFYYYYYLSHYDIAPFCLVRSFFLSNCYCYGLYSASFAMDSINGWPRSAKDVEKNSEKHSVVIPTTKKKNEEKNPYQSPNFFLLEIKCFR